MSSPRVSIIVPVLNTRPYLAECLDSLKAQTLTDIEIICVDNGSKDGSYELLREYASREPRMVVLRHEQGRQGGARNAGLRVARGEYLGFVDADDWVRPSMFEQLWKAACSSDSDIAICNGAAVLPELREPQATMIPPDLLSGEPVFDIVKRPRLLRSLVVWNKLFHREFLQTHDIAFPEGVYHEDQYYAAAALCLAHRICGVSEVLYFYRQDRLPCVGRDRTRDYEHVFVVFDLLGSFMSRRAQGSPACQLIEELAIVRILQLAGQRPGGCTRAYYELMKREVRQRHAGRHALLLTPTERREYRVVCRCGYTVYRLFILLRGVYGLTGRGYRRRRLTERTDRS